MQQPVEYIQRITDTYAKLGYQAYQWVKNANVSAKTFVQNRAIWW